MSKQIYEFSPNANPQLTDLVPFSNEQSGQNHAASQCTFNQLIQNRLNPSIQISKTQVTGISITEADTTNLLNEGSLNLYLTTNPGSSDNLLQAPNFTALQTEVGSIDSELTGHIDNTSNPHQTTLQQTYNQNPNIILGNGDITFSNSTNSVTEATITNSKGSQFHTPIYHLSNSQSITLDTNGIDILYCNDQTTSGSNSIAVQLETSPIYSLNSTFIVWRYAAQTLSVVFPSGVTLNGVNGATIPLNANDYLIFRRIGLNTYIYRSFVSSVNAQTGNVTLTGNNINSTYTATNYTPTSSTIDGNLAGIDAALGNVSVDVPLQDAYNAGNSITLNGIDPFLVQDSSLNQILRAGGEGTQFHAPNLNAGISTNLTAQNIDITFYNDTSTDSEVKIQLEPGSAVYPDNACFYAFRINASTNLTVSPSTGVTINGSNSQITVGPLENVFFTRISQNKWNANVSSSKPNSQNIYDNSPLSMPVPVQLSSSKPIQYFDSHGDKFFSLSDAGVQSSKIIYPLLAADTLSYDSIGTIILNQTGSSQNFSVRLDSVIDFTDGTEFDILIYEDPVVVQFDAGVEVNTKAGVTTQNLTYNLPFQRITFTKIGTNKWSYTISALLPVGTDYAYASYNIRNNSNYTTVPSSGGYVINVDPSTVNNTAGSLINFQIVTVGGNKIGLQFIGTESTLFETYFDGCFASQAGTQSYQIYFGVDSGSGVVANSTSIRFFSATTSFTEVVPITNTIILNPMDIIYPLVTGAFGTTISVNWREGTFTLKSIQPNAIIASSSTSGITEVNGQTGPIVNLNSDDIPGGSGNIYFSNDGGTTYNYPSPIVVSATSATLTPNRFHICTNSSLTSLSLPTANCPTGSLIHVTGVGNGLFQILQSAGQTIYFGNSPTTPGASGYLSVNAGNNYSCITLQCTNTNTNFVVFNGPQGNFTAH